MRVCLFEDRLVEDLEPLTLTRPAFDLLCGQTTLASKQWRFFHSRPSFVLVRPHLAELYQQTHPRLGVNDLDSLSKGPVVMVNGRWLPPAGVVADLGRPCVAVVGDEVAYAVIEPEHLRACKAGSIDECLPEWRRTLPSRSAGGRLVRHLWELVDLNGAQITLDFEQVGLTGTGRLPTGVAVVGPVEHLIVQPGARLDPLVVADTTGGPVVIDRDAVVAAFTRLEGPCYVGPGTHILGAKLQAGTSVGPQCRIGGEVECSVVLGWSNKYHDGFLGHAYVGEWVNLGAGTSNSDLRNDYGPVKVSLAGRRVDTGRGKVGCFLGDHTKSGLATLLNTGTVAGAFCNLLPCGGFLPRYVPSFTTVWDGALRESADIGPLLETARKVMRRRDRQLTDAHASLYQGLVARTALERQRALRESDQRRLRKTA